MRATHHALSRALSSWTQRGWLDLQRLFNLLAFELHGCVSSEFAATALLTQGANDSYCVGRSEDQATLPTEILIGLMTDGDQSPGCRVRDHSLDAVRLIDNRFRTSLVVRVDIPKRLVPESKGCLWFGLTGCATSHAIRDAENIARELSEWLEWYCPVIDASIRSFQERDAARRKVYEMVSVIHDARAPLGALKHLVSGASLRDEDGASPERELEYLEKLLALCAPSDKGSPSSSCDVSKVVARVCGRYERQQLRGRISWSRGYDPVYAKVVDLDLERVIANILSNAARYAPNAHVNVSVKQEGRRVIISIADDGPGISPGVLERLEKGRGLPYGGASGWGIGLQTSRDKVLSVGGDLRIASCLGRGTEVSILLEALAGRSRIEPQTIVADSAVCEAESWQRGSIYLVDDDADHAESLARILEGAGLQAIACSSLQSLLSQSSLLAHAIVLCDARMPDGGAEELLKVFAKRASSPTVAVMSGETGDESLYRFAALGAQAFFAKPIECGELATWIKNHQRRWG